MEENSNLEKRVKALKTLSFNGDILRLKAKFNRRKAVSR